MDAQSSTLVQDPLRSVTVGGNTSAGKAICRCGEGYTCVITRTVGPDAGKTYKCTGNCTCVLDGNADEGSIVQQKLESLGESSAYCECGEGWSCVITKT
eukprot:XP_015582831.1 uncharacterized protein LOC8277499 [Ricinus communis]